jgi:hypothetical protein
MAAPRTVPQANIRAPVNKQIDDDDDFGDTDVSNLLG